jgi:hypothetical protein
MSARRVGWLTLALAPLLFAVGRAAADSFSDAMAAAATILTIAILSEAVAAAFTTVAISEVATITAVAGSYFAAGGALNVGIGLTLMALPVVGVIAAVVAVGAAAVIISNIPAPVTAASINANAVTPPDGTPPAITALGDMSATGTLLTLQVVGGRGSDPGDDLDETIQAAINAAVDAGGLTSGDVPGSPPGSSPGLGLGLTVGPVSDPNVTNPSEGGLPAVGESVPGSEPGTDSCCAADVGLFMVANPADAVAVPWPSAWLLLLIAGVSWPLYRRFAR